jgi:hypothetical protein
VKIPKRNVLIKSLVIVIILFGVLVPAFRESFVTIVSVLAALAVFIQIREGTEVSRAEFVIGLHDTYSNSEKFTDLFLQCWNNYNSNISNEELEVYLQQEGMDKVLLNYLTFFESIYLMKEQGVLKFDILDELFGRRFFIVVNNRVIQEFDLLKNYKYYLNVIYLYNDWKKYRVRKTWRRENKSKLFQDMFIEFDEKHSKSYADLEEQLNSRTYNV